MATIASGSTVMGGIIAKAFEKVNPANTAKHERSGYLLGHHRQTERGEKWRNGPVDAPTFPESSLFGYSPKRHSSDELLIIEAPFV